MAITLTQPAIGSTGWGGDVNTNFQTIEDNFNTQLAHVHPDKAALVHTHILADLIDSGTIASQAASAVAITGGTIEGTAIGGVTPAAGAFTTLSSSGLGTLNSALITNALEIDGDLNHDGTNIGFFGTAPADQGSATEDIKDWLITIFGGLGGATPLDLDGGALTAGAGSFAKLSNTAGRISNTTRVTTTYTILVTDHVVFANTDGGDYTVTLPAGVEGQTYRIINSGSSTNTLTVAPDGSEDLLGANSSTTLADAAALVLTYNATDGWY